MKLSFHLSPLSPPPMPLFFVERSRCLSISGPDTLNLDECGSQELPSRPALKPLFRFTMRAWAARWTPSCEIARGTAWPIVEDNAHGLLRAYKGKLSGRLASFTTLSFHETKNVICGEGGAIVINDPGVVGACRDHSRERAPTGAGSLAGRWISTLGSILDPVI